MAIDKNTNEFVPYSVLEERGWTPQMLKIHRLDGTAQGWSLARAQAIEGTPDWQDDRARADAGLPLLYRRQELLADRRWSVTMVAEFLPEPDVVESLGPHRRRHSFAARRVEAIEATDRFKERAAIAAEMSRKAARSIERMRRQNGVKLEAEQVVAQLLAGFEYSVAGDETLAEVVALARVDWDADEDWREARGRALWTRPSDGRLAVDFLRHKRTAYDHQLGEIQHGLWELEAEVTDDEGENPIEPFFDELKNSAHAAIRARTLEVIESTFPQLADAVAQRRESNYVMSGGQLFHTGTPPHLLRR
ncbi:hypothetical protein QYM46_13800 [Brevibacterium sp. K11IcPPYGO002]|uniref:hypothetical protein n=1 Tax=Brevibacterium sp. K11IcPPYGO002 TaxID=3058837 RepID=UPI003D817BF5